MLFLPNERYFPPSEQRPRLPLPRKAHGELKEVVYMCRSVKSPNDIQVLFAYSLCSSVCNKTFSVFSPNNSFGICSSWGFQNTPYMFNLMKFWLRYLRLQTMDTVPNIDCSSTFYWLFRNEALSATLKIPVNSSCLSWGFQIWPCLMFEFYAALTEIFKVKDKAQFHNVSKKSVMTLRSNWAWPWRRQSCFYL